MVNRSTFVARTIAFIITGLVIGAGIGYFSTSRQYQQQNNDLEFKVTALESLNNNLESQVFSLESEITILEDENEDLSRLQPQLNESDIPWRILINLCFHDFRPPRLTL